MKKQAVKSQNCEAASGAGWRLALRLFPAFVARSAAGIGNGGFRGVC